MEPRCLGRTSSSMASLCYCVRLATVSNLRCDRASVSGFARSFSSGFPPPPSLICANKSSSSRTNGGGVGGNAANRHLSCATGSYEEARPALTHICHRIEVCFFEVCVQNLGRPIALALHGFVSAAMEAFCCGYTRDQISLQLAFGSAAMHEFEIGEVGNRLTSTEERYRSQWLDTVYTTLQILNDIGNDASALPLSTDIYLYGTIKHIVEGQKSGDEQSMITFDRGLATRGASGGVVAGKTAIAPQLVPISQIVLLTMKVLNEQRGSSI